MEGKRLFYPTKTCDSTGCVNNHSAGIEKIENYIVAMFDTNALNNRIIPKPTCVEKSTHIQYVDINGTIHIRPRGLETQVLSDIVNFRLLTLFSPLTSFPSLETKLGGVIDAYNKHLVKPC